MKLITFILCLAFSASTLAEITYPVDVANTRWAAASISSGEILKHNQKWPRADGGEIQGLDPDIALLLEVDAAQPTYDPDTERLVRSTPVVDIPNNTHTHGWTVVALTQDEIDANTERQQAKDAYVQLKAHSGTADQRATLLENVTAWFIKDRFGEE